MDRSEKGTHLTGMRDDSVTNLNQSSFLTLDRCLLYYTQETRAISSTRLSQTKTVFIARCTLEGGEDSCY